MNGIALFVLAVNLALHRPLRESLLFAVAPAGGLSPELLHAIIGVFPLARAMSKRGEIVRLLDAIENLGNTDVLCTDKTSTLTEGLIFLSGALDTKGTDSDGVRQLAYLNAAFETGIKNPLDEAIVQAGKSAGITTAGHVALYAIPYIFLRRRLTIVVIRVASPKVPLILIKGASAELPACCVSLQKGATEVPLDAAARSSLDAEFKTKGGQGILVLGFATHKTEAKSDFDRADEAEMTFRGCLTFSDPPKADAAKMIGNLAPKGVDSHLEVNRFFHRELSHSPTLGQISG